MIEAVRQDLRQAFRHLRASPGFAAAVILTVALGVGVNAGMFSLLNGLLLRPLNIPDPHGLVGVTSLGPEDQRRFILSPTVDRLHEDGPLDHACAYNAGVLLALDVNGQPMQASGGLVTGRCFDAFGIRPQLGRFIDEEDAPVAGRGAMVAVISHGFWQRAFGGDPAAVGSLLRLEGGTLTVIGVTPPGFVGLEAHTGIEVFAPFHSILPGPADRPPGAPYVLGRLRPGVTLEQTASELAARWPTLMEAVVPAGLTGAARRELTDVRARVLPMGTGVSTYRDRFSGSVSTITGLSLALLLLAGLNLGGLLLARFVARQPEIAVRLTLGASRTRVARQMLIENVLLALTGALIAVPVSFAVTGPFAGALPQSFTPVALSFDPDGRVFALTAAAAGLTALLMSTIPLYLLGRRATAGPQWGRAVAGAPRHLPRALIVAQVTLSLALLVGAGLLGRSLQRLYTADTGVRADGVLIVRAMPVPNGYAGIENAAYYPPLLERLAAIPGVSAAGYSRMFPRFSAETPGQPIGVIGDEDRGLLAYQDVASPGFFETVGVPLLHGRLPAWTDTLETAPVAVVNERLARMLVSDGDVIGRRVRFGSNARDQEIEIVGVVGNATLGGLREAAPPVIYRPPLQYDTRFANFPSIALRVSGDPAAVAADARRVLAEGGREYAQDISLLSDILTRAPANERISAVLAGAVAALASLITFVGVIGLLAWSVSRRTREIGVRMAVGASQRSVVWMVVREGVALVAVGVLLGVPVALAAAGALRHLLFGVTEHDPTTYAGVATFLVMLGVVAALVPARRAATVDPVVALRAE